MFVGRIPAPMQEDWEEIVPSRVWIRGSFSLRWRSETGVVHLVDGFMLDQNAEPVSTAVDPNPATDGYGNFGYIRIDQNTGEIQIYADACESRNIFHCHIDGGVLFANSLTWLVDLASIRDVNSQALFGYLQFGYLNVNHQTLFHGVSKLKACERARLVLTDSKLEVKLDHYWKPSINTLSLSRDEALEAVEENLCNFFRGALKCNMNVLTTLTCGTDSNLFYYILEKYLGRLPSITHAFAHSDYDEFRLIQQAREVRADNMKIVSHDDVMAYLSDAIEAIGMPINGLASMGEYKVYRQAHNMGGNALITGAGDYIWVPTTQAKMDEILAAKRLAYAGDGALLSPADYLLESFVKTESDKEIEFYSLDIVSESRLKNHLIDQVFVKRTPHIAFDHSALGTAFGLECIQPFVEKRTIEFCLALVDNVLFFDDLPKSLLVTLLKKFYGKPFPKGLKMNTPQRELIRGIYRPSIEKLIADSRLVAAGYVDGQRLANMYHAYLSQKELGNSYFAWKFIVTEIWYRRFICGERFDLHPTYSISPAL